MEGGRLASEGELPRLEVTSTAGSRLQSTATAAPESKSTLLPSPSASSQKTSATRAAFSGGAAPFSADAAAFTSEQLQAAALLAKAAPAALRFGFMRRCPSAPSELSAADQERLLQQQRLHLQLLQLERKVTMQERLLCQAQIYRTNHLQQQQQRQSDAQQFPQALPSLCAEDNISKGHGAAAASFCVSGVENTLHRPVLAAEISGSSSEQNDGDSTNHTEPSTQKRNCNNALDENTTKKNFGGKGIAHAVAEEVVTTSAMTQLDCKLPNVSNGLSAEHQAVVHDLEEALNHTVSCNSVATIGSVVSAPMVATKTALEVGESKIHSTSRGTASDRETNNHIQESTKETFASPDKSKIKRVESQSPDDEKQCAVMFENSNVSTTAAEMQALEKEGEQQLQQQQPPQRSGSDEEKNEGRPQHRETEATVVAQGHGVEKLSNCNQSNEQSDSKCGTHCPERSAREKPKKSRTMLPPARAVDQFFRIKLCPKFLRQSCRKGSRCLYAHSEEELRKVPNLWKTKLCTAHRLGRNCSMESACPYAHGEEELRHTPDYYKTKLCKFWMREARCEAGDACRHAHWEQELRSQVYRVHDGEKLAGTSQARHKQENRNKEDAECKTQLSSRPSTTPPIGPAVMCKEENVKSAAPRASTDRREWQASATAAAATSRLVVPFISTGDSSTQSQKVKHERGTRRGSHSVDNIGEKTSGSKNEGSERRLMDDDAGGQAPRRRSTSKGCRSKNVETSGQQRNLRSEKGCLVVRGEAQFSGDRKNTINRRNSGCSSNSVAPSPRFVDEVSGTAARWHDDWKGGHQLLQHPQQLQQQLHRSGSGSGCRGGGPGGNEQHTRGLQGGTQKQQGQHGNRRKPGRGTFRVRRDRESHSSQQQHYQQGASQQLEILQGVRHPVNESSPLDIAGAATSALYSLTAGINPYSALAACQQQAAYPLGLISAPPPSRGEIQAAAAAAAAVAAIAQQQHQQLEAAAKAVRPPVYQNLSFLGAPPFDAPFPASHLPYSTTPHQMAAAYRQSVVAQTARAGSNRTCASTFPRGGPTPPYPPGCPYPSTAGTSPLSADSGVATVTAGVNSYSHPPAPASTRTLMYPACAAYVPSRTGMQENTSQSDIRSATRRRESHSRGPEESTIPYPAYPAVLGDPQNGKAPVAGGTLPGMWLSANSVCSNPGIDPQYADHQRSLAASAEAPDIQVDEGIGGDIIVHELPNQSRSL